MGRALRRAARVAGVTGTIPTDAAPPPLRVLVVYEEYGRYGTPMLARTLIGALADHVEVTVVAPDQATASWIAAERPSATTIAAQPVKGWRSLGALRAYRRIIKQVRPHVVHLCFPTPRTGTRYVALAAWSVRGVRCIGAENAYDAPAHPWSRLSTWVAVAALDIHVAVGHKVARIIERDYRLRAGSIRAIHCAVTPRPVVAPRSFGPQPIVGTVTRLSPEKGVDVALRALAAMPETIFVVVGDGGQRADLEQLARDLDRADHTVFVGYQAEPQDSFAGMDVVVQASRREAMGLSILEAMAAGIPVVATDVGSTSESVADGVTGFLVPAGDTVALADRIDQLVRDGELRARMGAAARARYEAHFTAAHHARAWEALYDELAPPATRARRTAVTT
jgi:glycosyltransferase involved in cell wall biosynthesis